MSGTQVQATVRYGEASGRWVLLATVAGSGMAFVDASIVNVALPRLGRDLGASLSALQWTVNGYTLALASLILLGGSLGDLFGRRKVFLVGVVWFATASLLCGLAPTMPLLVASRVLQGVGGALLAPGSLSILASSFAEQDRPRAIGAWSGLGGVAGALGPLLGGWIIAVASWRWAFLVNVPLAVVVVVVSVRKVPETRDTQASRELDIRGAVLAVLGLGGLTYGLIAWPAAGPGSVRVAGSLAVGAVALAAFVVAEQRSAHPMVPLAVFASRQFSVVNVVTLVIYAALSGLLFLLVLELQVVSRFSPLQAGTSLLPVTLMLLLLSARAGALAQRIGPRLPMTVGPLLAASAALWLTRVGPAASYWADVLPPLVLFGLGMSLTVAPLTSTVLAAADVRHAGVASGVNNAVARAGGLLAIATLPLLIGLDGHAYSDPARLEPAYRSGMAICAGLIATGAVLSALFVRRPAQAVTAP